jgi:hypothetical protein
MKEQPRQASDTDGSSVGEPTRVDVLASVAAGALAFGLAGLPSGVAAATAARMSKSAMNGPMLLESLENAGLNPKELNLRQILGPRRDLEELQALLTGPAGKEASKWPVICIGCVIVTK